MATSNVLREFANQSLRKSESLGTSVSDDSVEISALAGFLNRLAELPEDRVRKIIAVRNQIQNGTYETQERLDTATERLLTQIQAP